jgi:DNA polymerase III subunit gamma/tau
VGARANAGGRAAGRAAARAASAGRTGPGRQAARAGTSGAEWSGSAGEEPPYDPDYDPPSRDPRAYEGFDPGDEPLDDVDERAVRQTSEQQALQLLHEALGAEKIGDVESGRRP